MNIYPALGQNKTQTDQNIVEQKGFKLFNFLDVWDKNTCCGWGSIGETAPAHHLYTISHLRRVQSFDILWKKFNVPMLFLDLFVLVLHHCGEKNKGASRGREKIFLFGEVLSAQDESSSCDLKKMGKIKYVLCFEYDEV